MRKWIIFLLPLLLLLGYLSRPAQKEAHEVQDSIIPFKKSETIKPIQPLILSTKLTAARLPAQVFRPSLRPSPTLPLKDFVRDESVIMSGGEWLLKDIGVVPKASYQAHMGVVVSEQKGYVFFKKDSLEASWPVAYDPSSRMLYPVVHILHLREVTEETRATLLAEGQEEYYYHSRLKLLSLMSSPSEVLKLYH